MPKSTSAKRYAQAVFDLAVDRDRVDEWAGDLAAISEAVKDNELRAFLQHAKVPLANKLQVISEAFSSADPIVQNLVSLLISRGLTDQVGQVEEWYLRLLNQRRGREDVEVWSAVDMDDVEKDRVKNFLEQLLEKEVELHIQVDSEILGGLVMRVGDKLIDGSARTRLERMGRQLQRETMETGA
jgi:F-type H+-transporting ATPase subunit delta